MIRVGRKEGLRAPLFGLAAVVLSICCEIAYAQTVDRSDLELCAGLETAELKLVCFEAIIAASKAQEHVGSRKSAVSRQEIEVSIEPPAQSTRHPGAIESLATDDSETTNLETGTNAGGEKIQRADAYRKGDVIVATVTKVRRAANKKLYFTLENGQVWRQMERGYIQYPRSENFEIEITRGIMGDYKLRVGGKGRMTRIVRME